MLLATDLAEALVRSGVPFREAHEVVGKLVAHCLAQRLDLRTLSADALRHFHPRFAGGASELLALERALEERAMIGATARVRVVEALAEAGQRLDAEAAALAREQEASA